MKHRFILSVLLLVFIHVSCIGQVELKVLTPKMMKKDLKVLLEAVVGHPDPYTKISEDEFLAIVAEVEEKILVEMDELDFYKNISKIISTIGDGHTSVNMHVNWLKEMRKKHGVFPYEVFLDNEGALYVIKTYGDSQITLGSQILEINGMAVDAFVEAVTPHLSFETIPFRNDQISEGFEFLLYLIFKEVNQLRIKYKLSEVSEVTIPTMPFSAWRILKKDLRDEREVMIAKGKPYDFEILKPGIAKISIFSFGVSDLDRYNFFLNETFKKIAKNDVHSLIIDVRGNYGGFPKVSSELFHFIHDGHFKTMAQSTMKISFPYRRYFTKRYPQLLQANIEFGPERRHYLDIQAIIQGKLDSYKNEDIFFNESPITENYEFAGDCYLLVDRKSYSASSAFASTFQCYSMGTLIGEPTGGTKIFRANAFGKILPKSKCIVRMSTTKMYTACFDQENQPVLPNIEVIPSIIDRVHNSDSQQNFTIRLIDKVQKERKKGK